MLTCFCVEENKYNVDVWEKIKKNSTWNEVYSIIKSTDKSVDTIGFIHFPHDTRNIIWSRNS